jgi:superfamily II DNA or RNA helicase
MIKHKIHATKDRVQSEGLKAYRDNGYKGTVCICTGGGKTRVGVLAAMECTGNVLIITPSTTLRDKEWVDEFVKWTGSVPDNVTIECIQTAYTRIFRKYQLVIIDEIHRSFGPEYRHIYQIDRERTLGLTATPPLHNEEGMELLAEYCPIVYELDINKGVELGIVSPFKVYNLRLSFTPSERGKYAKFDKMFSEARNALMNYIKLNRLEIDLFQLADKASKDSEHSMNRYARQFWQFMQLRKHACYNASKKLDLCKQIVDKYPDNTWIIFCKSKKFAENVAKHIGDKAKFYHSGQSAKKRKSIIDSYNNGEFKVLCSVDALKEGFNLPIIEHGITASGDSVYLNQAQSIGRTIRLVEGKNSKFINLYVGNSQEEKWVKKRTEGFDPDWVTTIP